MSYFYGILNGRSKYRVTRCGTKRSGLTAIAASWQGSVRTVLYEVNGEDWAHVSLEPWEGAGTSRVLYDGPVSGAP